MIRMQVQLSESQREAVRQLAHRQQRSEAAVVREAVDLYLRNAPDDRQRRMIEALSHAGRHRSGLRDVSARHDDYLARTILNDQ